jgi:virulence-associated protein VagC
MYTQNVHPDGMKTETSPRAARSFRNGNSVAVRMPKGWVKPGVAFKVSRNGQHITLKSCEKRPRTVAQVLERMAKYGLQNEPFEREQLPAQDRDFFKD